MKYLLVYICFMLCQSALKAQQLQAKDRFADIAATVGPSRGSASVSFVNNWRLFKQRKFEAGVGLRFTSGFGVKQEYITAPAKLARANTIPFLIVFAGQNTVNWDTLTVQRPLVNSLNVSANLGYNFNTKWSAGFNIDVIGFAFGRKNAAILLSNGVTMTEPAAKPSNFNLLLTGDLDYGNLNSEFFLKYKLNKQFALRAIYQFYFTEYNTKSIKQTAPDGSLVTRFRQKQNNLGLGLSWHF